jgi:small subunit ribosomal protein S4
MGDPKKQKKQYNTPRRLWQVDQISRELYLLGKYGLRNKRELWKAETDLSRIRKQARKLLAESIDERIEDEKKLLDSLRRKGIISETSGLDDVLGLTVENLLERRLQTVVLNKSITESIHKARQIVTHRQIIIKNNVVSIPSYLVKIDEEPTVRIRKEGQLNSDPAKPKQAIEE